MTKQELFYMRGQVGVLPCTDTQKKNCYTYLRFAPPTIVVCIAYLFTYQGVWQLNDILIKEQAQLLQLSLMLHQRSKVAKSSGGHEFCSWYDSSVRVHTYRATELCHLLAYQLFNDIDITKQCSTEVNKCAMQTTKSVW